MFHDQFEVLLIQDRMASTLLHHYSVGMSTKVEERQVSDHR